MTERRMRLENRFYQGETVISIKTGTVYEFGYESAKEGYAVVHYKKGERSTQNSDVVKLTDLRRLG